MPLEDSWMFASDLQPEKTPGTIKEQLAAISPSLEQLNRKKESRVKEFADVLLQIQTLRGEIAGNLQVGDHLETPHINEDDLSVKKLNEFLSELQALQKEKVVTIFIVSFAMFNLSTVLFCLFANSANIAREP
jgi:hypothetical protein